MRQKLFTIGVCRVYVKNKYMTSLIVYTRELIKFITLSEVGKIHDGY